LPQRDTPFPGHPSGYSGEIKTYLGGWGMEGLLASRAPVLSGIVNGIDMEE
jgi:starch synthase